MLWTIDPTHAAVEFSVKHMGISTVKGAFNSFTATGETNDAGVPTSLSMEIDADSISTNNADRDTHLRSGDFFDVAEYPKLTFVSTKVSGVRGELTITGDLTIRGVTRPVTLTGELSETVTDPWGNTRTSLAVSGKISRKEWGLTWNQALEFGGFMVSDEVKLHVEAEAVAQVEAGEAVGA
ncbi:MAG: YceI family protein [Gemmatimonadota bacterium]|nr:YceI family protein [Gemmatimonadota bacterium]